MGFRLSRVFLAFILFTALTGEWVRAESCLLRELKGLVFPGEDYSLTPALIDLDRDFLSLPPISRHIAEIRNRKTLLALNTTVIPPNPRRKGKLERSEVEAVFERIKRHPVVSIDEIDRYDPSGKMGFCFGRAMAAHIDLLHSGVQKEAIRKIWAVGPMQTRDRYHVATIVKSTGGKWMVIDPIFRSPLSAEAWSARMQDLSTNHMLQIFVSEAKRLSPLELDNYLPEVLKVERYRIYFHDMLRSFRKARERKVPSRTTTGNASTQKSGLSPSEVQIETRPRGR